MSCRPAQTYIGTSADYAHLWAPSTIYAAGAVIQSPLGIAMARKAAGTSGLTWAADLRSWVAADSGRWWNVKDFGAKGDYSTDDTDAIQAAMNAAVATSAGLAGVGPAVGGIVYFPKGWYQITAVLDVPATGVQLHGVTRSSTVVYAGAGFPTNSPMVLATNDSGAASTMFESSINRLTLHCNDIAGSVGWKTTTGQEGYGLFNARIRNYKGCAVRISAPATSAEFAAEITVADSELWSSYAGSNQGIDIDAAVGAIYIHQTTILGLNRNAVIAAPAIRNNGARLFARDLHLENYIDGVLTLNGGWSDVKRAVGYKGIGSAAGHALISFDNGKFEWRVRAHLLRGGRRSDGCQRRLHPAILSDDLGWVLQPHLGQSEHDRRLPTRAGARQLRGPKP